VNITTVVKLTSVAQLTTVVQLTTRTYCLRKCEASSTVRTKPRSFALKRTPLCRLDSPNARSRTVICDDKYTVTLCESREPTPKIIQKGTRLRNCSSSSEWPLFLFRPNFRSDNSLSILPDLEMERSTIESSPPNFVSAMVSSMKFGFIMPFVTSSKRLCSMTAAPFPVEWSLPSQPPLLQAKVKHIWASLIFFDIFCQKKDI